MFEKIEELMPNRLSNAYYHNDNYIYNIIDSDFTHRIEFDSYDNYNCSEYLATVEASLGWKHSQLIILFFDLYFEYLKRNYDSKYALKNCIDMANSYVTLPYKEPFELRKLLKTVLEYGNLKKLPNIDRELIDKKIKLLELLK